MHVTCTLDPAQITKQTNKQTEKTALKSFATELKMDDVQKQINAYRTLYMRFYALLKNLTTDNKFYDTINIKNSEKEPWPWYRWNKSLWKSFFSFHFHQLINLNGRTIGTANFTVGMVGYAHLYRRYYLSTCRCRWIEMFRRELLNK